MDTYRIIGVFWALIPSLLVSSEHETVVRLSDTEANAIIATNSAAKKAAAKAVKATLLAERSVVEETVAVEGGRMLLRKVAARPIPQKPDVAPKNEARQNFSPEFLAQIEAMQILEPAQLRLTAVVYGNEYSELTLSLEAERYQIFTNVDYSYLPFMGDFQTAERDYRYAGFNYRINQQTEQQRMAIAKQHGFEVESRWVEPPVSFTSKEPEYVIVTHDDRDIPKEVYRQLDDLMGYYLDNFERLKVTQENSRKLAAARERYYAAQPENSKPKEIILNYSRASEPAR